MILLFHRVDIIKNNSANAKSSIDDNEDEEREDDVLEAIYIAGMTLPYFSYEVTGWILSQVLTC